ncbi:MAG: filamentous hemagglutinin N-terminal domain-containing protein [Nitrosomonas sp.]|nr:MAG: filamentous hemagglutinin N-terminal domain-containing protein [Nitrosomonas sp.]
MSLRADFYVFLIAGIVLFGGTAMAANTHIQTDSTLSGIAGLNINTPGSGHPYTLSEINGKLSGHNLFYSFSDFSIGTTDTAWFDLSTPNLANVISRVTGGSESLIDGKLQMTNAGSSPSFFFINPAGITFGSGASVDVPGSFYVSMASGVNFRDGSQWTVSEFHASTLSAANPESFGFLGNEGGNINIGDANPTNLTFKPGTTVVFAGNDIHINNTVIRNEAFTKDAVIRNEAFSKAGLDLQFFATGNKAMNLKSGIPVEKVTTGDLYITNSFFDPSGNGLGRIIMSSGNLFSSSSDFWVVNTADLSMGSDQGINLYADSINLQQANLFSYAIAKGSGSNINVTANSMTANNGTSIVSEAASDGAGGAIIITAGTFNLENGSAVRSKTTSQAASGDILINTKSLEINKSNITNTTEGGGDTGSIAIKTDSLLMNDGSGIVLFTSAKGNAGALTIDSKLIAMDKGFIANKTSGDGKAGDINIDTGTLKISYSGEIDPDFKSGIDAGTFANGKGGNVTVNADQIEITHGFIGTSTGGKDVEGNIIGGIGAAGAVFLKADSLELEDSGIVSNTLSKGAGGLVSIEVKNNLNMINSNITNDAISEGNAGSLNLSVGTMWMDSGSRVSSSTTERGNAGQISIIADELTITNNATILNKPFGEGDAGSISISARALYLNNGGLISSSPKDLADGSDGEITLATKQVEISNGGELTIDAEYVEINNGAILNVALSKGDAGKITIQSDVLKLNNKGLISTSTLENATGDGGVITIHANRLEINDGNIGTTTFGAGKAGGGLYYRQFT